MKSLLSLLPAMKRTHASHKDLEKHWMSFLETCFNSPVIFQSSMQLKPPRGHQLRSREPRSRKQVSPSHSKQLESSDRKSSPEDTKSFSLKNLDHNDTNSFLLNLEQLLQDQLKSRPHLKLFSIMTTQYNNQQYHRLSAAAAERTLQLSVSVNSSGCIQTAVTDYLAPERLDNVHWESQGDLPEGHYQTERSRSIQIEQTLQHFRVFLGECWRTEQHEEIKHLQAAIDQAFKPITIPIISPDNKSMTQLDAHPVCIITRAGICSHAGHYETLIKSQGHWLLVDANPLEQLESPERYLRNRDLYPHTIGYRIF
ncbi:hypothetical protein M3P05_05565 [Sansalvadorimonas sp. 2012CJ34-2]|uniref:Uncharacterized protein n=1 Tax=Parendozoicomonas callyspongiae TaxID=2942213 RepID=A0ABT0PDG3_9GAMM|nr:hypothetical protein [Sansalvadorimonas sp. 2012CJ34-2]MCL6269412.1 hypothetical protein [Sansalvadorimonas sp. 2012CJ34-2]